jgi:hypothetical protein
VLGHQLGEHLVLGLDLTLQPGDPFLLDGYSRSIVGWSLRESMKESDIEIVLLSPA